MIQVVSSTRFADHRQRITGVTTQAAFILLRRNLPALWILGLAGVVTALPQLIPYLHAVNARFRLHRPNGHALQTLSCPVDAQRYGIPPGEITASMHRTVAAICARIAKTGHRAVLTPGDF